MSYTVLARKWRPKSFTELVGQDHVMQALSNALDQQRLHHAYLFTGTRGVGKTTIARIFSKALNCEQGVSSTPCGVCSVCRSIDEGRFVDLIEVDAASRTKVEDTREILDNVQYAPTQGRYKVYLIDEVHMLSKSSFNALLKTLEEPPAHVKFLLATTDPHKLPITVLSRCLQFNLLRLTSTQIQQHLAHILQAEGVDYENAALALIAKGADGSARDALSLLDQAIAYCGGQLSFDSVQSMLGLVDQGKVLEILQALADNSALGLKQVLSELALLGVDYVALLNQLLETLHQLALKQILGDFSDQDVINPERLHALSEALGADKVQLLYQIGLLARQDMKLAPDVRIGFEMALLRMLAFTPYAAHAPSAMPEQPSAAPVSAQQARQQLLQQRQKKNLEPDQQALEREEPVPDRPVAAKQMAAVSEFPQLMARQQMPEPVLQATTPAAKPIADFIDPQSLQPPLDARPSLEPISESEPAAEAELKPAPASELASKPALVPESEPVPHVEEVPVSAQQEEEFNPAQGQIELWLQLIERIQPEGMALELARQSMLVKHGEQAWWLSVDPRRSEAKTEKAQQRLLEAAQAKLGAHFCIHYIEYSGEFCTPNLYYKAQQAQLQQQACAAIKQDSNIALLEQGLDMKLLEKSIQPIQSSVG